MKTPTLGFFYLVPLWNHYPMIGWRRSLSVEYIISPMSFGGMFCRKCWKLLFEMLYFYVLLYFNMHLDTFSTRHTRTVQDHFTSRWFNSIPLHSAYSVKPRITTDWCASEGFTICPRTTSLFQDLTSDLPLPLPGAEAFVIPKPR